MTDDFDVPSPRPIESDHVKAWKHELDLINKELNVALDALIEELNTAPFNGNSKATRRVEHEIKGMSELMSAIKKALERV
jgi:hypothetical protein